ANREWMPAQSASSGAVTESLAARRSYRPSSLPRCTAISSIAPTPASKIRPASAPIASPTSGSSVLALTSCPITVMVVPLCSGLVAYPDNCCAGPREKHGDDALFQFPIPSGGHPSDLHE